LEFCRTQIVFLGWQLVTDSNRCERDDDCVGADSSVSCHGACPRAINALHASTFKAGVTHLNKRYCAPYIKFGERTILSSHAHCSLFCCWRPPHASGATCGVQTPMCAMAKFSCVAGRCSAKSQD
jgi:hypothetical protein